MEKNTAITVKDVKLKYVTLKKVSMKKTITQLFKSKKEEFTALDGVSFEVENGKILGLIGDNGSGKSTLLRLIAGIFSPDEGSVDLHGRSISLLSIGVGFKKKLTGKENIYLSGLLLGFSREHIDKKIDEIIAFSELGDFINKPVKTYSSGMYSKLAFSITAMLETDIILIDEVLSVGDAKFKKKSFGKMKELIQNQNRTVVIVSHSLSTLRELCDTVIWLAKGKILEQGTPQEVLEKYEKYSS